MVCVVNASHCCETAKRKASKQSVAERCWQRTELTTGIVSQSVCQSASHPSDDRVLSAEVGFKLRLVHVTFVVDKVTLGHVPPPPYRFVRSSWSKFMLHSPTTDFLTSLLIPWSKVHLEKLTDFQQVKKFPTIYGTRRFITAFSSARHLSPYPEPARSSQ